MAREIPEVVRAAAGLAATVLDEARKLPETLPGLPVRVIGLAMQHAMKVQQQYAGFVARGDELFTGLRGEDEPGLATFDDDEPATTPGFRDSAFDRAGDAESADTATSYAVTDAEVSQLPEDPAVEAPATEEILDELAIDEMVGDAPETTTAETTTANAKSTANGRSGTPASTAPATAPIDGYDDFSIAQLRGRLRGYALSTVTDLVGYEEANRAREPYLRMLRGRLQKLEEQPVGSSPLAPRGA